VAKGDGTYKVLVGGKVVTYTNWNDIPDSFENMISFEPEAPPSPHSEEDHKYIETFNDKLQELMMREEE
tara:strand:+ start:618 stop:824 length:207 start_codon:yes stop_codon:yes gene_type:complete